MGCCSAKRSAAEPDAVDAVDVDVEMSEPASRAPDLPRADSMTGVPLHPTVSEEYTSLRFRKNGARWVRFKIVSAADGAPAGRLSVAELMARYDAEDARAAGDDGAAVDEADDDAPAERLSVADLKARYSGDAGEARPARVERSASSYSHRNYCIVVDGAAAPKSESTEGDWARFVAGLPADDCRYGVFDLQLRHADGHSSDKLVFVLWAPDAASNSSKMLYAASKSAVVSELKGIAVIHSATDAAELKLEAVTSRVPGGAVAGEAAEAEEVANEEAPAPAAPVPDEAAVPPQDHEVPADPAPQQE